MYFSGCLRDCTYIRLVLCSGKGTTIPFDVLDRRLCSSRQALQSRADAVNSLLLPGLNLVLDLEQLSQQSSHRSKLVADLMERVHLASPAMVGAIEVL